MAQTANDYWTSLKCEVCGGKQWLVPKCEPGPYWVSDPRAESAALFWAYVCLECGNEKLRRAIIGAST